MTDQESTSAESDQTTYSLDDEDQLQPEDTLVDRGTDDALDEGYSPPDRPHPGSGVTASEQREGESIDDRILQEVPDPDSAYGAPDNESGLDAPDPDLASSDEETAGDREVGDERAGRLVADDEGAHEDTESDLIAGDVGIDGAGASAEEAAMHVIPDSDSDNGE